MKVLGKDWRMLDWRTASKPLKKVNKIQDAKRIFLTKEADGQFKVRAEPFFRVDTGKPVPLQKQPVPVSMPPAVPLGRCLSEQKVADIHKLLGVTYGEQWWEKPELKLYKDCLQRVAHLRGLIASVAAVTWTLVCTFKINVSTATSDSLSTNRLANI